MHIPHAHSNTKREPRRGRCWPPERATPENEVDISRGERPAFDASARSQGVAGSNLVSVDKPMLDEQPLQAEKPSLIVGACQVDLRRKQFRSPLGSCRSGYRRDG